MTDSFVSKSLCAVLLLAVMTAPAAIAQMSDASGSDSTNVVNAASVTPDDGQPIVLSVDQAIQIALRKNLDVQSAELDVRDANAQVREAWGEVLPSVDLNSQYTRNILQANPFAGSDISSIFGGGSASDWVAYNETQRQDGDPTTEPIPFDEFAELQRRRLQQQGASFGGGGNPFGIDNEFQSGVQITQTLYSGRAFSAIKGASQFKDVSRFARDRQVQLVSNDVIEAYYRALLAQESARVVQQRLDRSKATLQEVSTQVRQGVVPKYRRLSAEVEASNTRTELIQARNDAELALDNFKNVLGLPASTPVKLDGALETTGQDPFMRVAKEDAVSRAMNRRPDLQRAQLAIELEQVQKNTTRAQYYPTVEAVANFNYVGRVPDDRAAISTTNPQDPTDPFFYEEQNRGFFDTSFWDPSISAGIRLSWNLFNGFQTTSQMQQRTIAVQRAELQHEQLRRAVELEVTRAMRTLETARDRIQSQQQNVQVAETNYEYTETRVQEGVSSMLELREASDQLDRSRLNYLQAVFDFLVARSDLETATGTPVSPVSESFMMTRR